MMNLSEKTFGVYCSHAAGAGCCDRLPIIGILSITAGKYAWNVGPHRSSICLEIADIVHVQNILE